MSTIGEAGSPRVRVRSEVEREERGSWKPLSESGRWEWRVWSVSISALQVSLPAPDDNSRCQKYPAGIITVPGIHGMSPPAPSLVFRRSISSRPCPWLVQCPGEVERNWFCLWAELSVYHLMLIISDKSLIGQLSQAQLVIVYWLLVVIRSSSLQSPVCRIETFLTLIVMLIVQLASLSAGVVTRSVSRALVRGWFTVWRGLSDDYLTSHNLYH